MPSEEQILADRSHVSGGVPAPPARGSARRLDSRAHPAARWATFLAGVALVLLYALRGGAYNLVVFESYGLVIWWILGAGVLAGVLPRARPATPVLMLLGGLLAYAGWTALSLLWTASAQYTTIEIARVLDYLGVVTLIAASVERSTWRAAAAGVGVGAWLVCLLAIGSRLFPGAYPSGALATSLGTDRLSFPFGYWNAVGAWGSITATLSLAWSAHAAKRPVRAVSAAIAPAALTIVYLSYSRAAVGGVVLGLMLVLALSRNRFTAVAHALAVAAGTGLVVAVVRGHPQIAHATGTSGAGTVATAIVFATLLCAGLALVTQAIKLDDARLPARVGRALAVIAGLIALVVAAGFGPHLARHAWNSFTRSPTAVSSVDPTARLTNLSGTRYPVWKVAMHAFDHEPVLGTGAGTFWLYWNQHATDNEFLRDVHNIWLQNMAELGLPGLLLIVLVFVSAILLGWRVLKRARRRETAGPAAGALAVVFVFLLQATFDWMWEVTAVTVLVLALVACAGARLSDHPLRTGWALRTGLAAFCGLAALVQIPGLLSTVEIDKSQAAVRAGDMARALAWAGDAVDAEPWSASAYDQRGLVEEAEGSYAAAAADIRRAIFHQRSDYANWLILSRIETERGDLSAAVADYRAAYSLRPQGALIKPSG